MGDVDVKTRREAEEERAPATLTSEPAPPRAMPRRGLRIFPLLMTLAVIAVAVVLGRAIWTPKWERRGRATVRCAPTS
jgi:hypothetical protein